MTTLVPMRQDVFSAYLESAVAGYANDNVATGRWPAEGAQALYASLGYGVTGMNMLKVLGKHGA